MDMIKDEKRKVWLSLMVIFTFGALTVNAVWVYYYNKIDIRHVTQIDEISKMHDDRIEKQALSYELQIAEMRDRNERMERSHKYQMGEMRNRLERKVDQVISKLEKLPPTPVVIDVKREIEKVKND